jgi:DNA primase
MPGIDFAEFRKRITLPQVPRLLHFHPIRSSKNQLRGPCPFACSEARRSFLAYLESDRYYCFSRRRSGNPLDLWAGARQLSVYEAARDLCRRLGIEPPPIDRW